MNNTQYASSTKETHSNAHMIVDYLAYDKIVIEIKAIKQLSPTEEAQLLNYLKASKLKLGLLINFGNPPKLEWSRRILSRSTYQIKT